MAGSHDRFERRSIRMTALAALLTGPACSGEIGHGPGAGAALSPGAPTSPSTRPPGETGPTENEAPPALPVGNQATPPTSVTPAMVTCADTASGAGPRRLHRLTAAQFRNSLTILFAGRQVTPRPSLTAPISTAGLFETESPDRFSTYAGATTIADLDAYRSHELATDAANRLVSLLTKDPASCLATKQPAFPECLARLVRERGALLFRRPLTAEEVRSYVDPALASVGSLGETDAAAAVLQTLILSPHSLFRAELGQGAPDTTGLVRLSPFEIAASLALTLTDWPPDQALWAAAEKNELRTPEQIRAQVERLVGPLGDNPKLLSFLREHFGYGTAGLIPKDSKLYPFHDGEGLVEDTDALAKDLLSTSGRKDFLRTLLTTPETYARASTATTYGLTGVTGTAGTKRTAPAGQRGGLLTQPSFLVAYSDVDHTQPVQRGRFVREKLLCDVVPDLPIDEVPPLPDLGPTATMRQKLKVHTEVPGCASCHALMDPIGLGFEDYDHVGRFRTMDVDGKAVDTSGMLAGAGNVDGAFNGAVALGTRLAASATVRQCFSRQLFRFVMGREDLAADACSVVDADAAFAQEGDLVALIAAIASSRAFQHRHVDR